MGQNNSNGKKSFKEIQRIIFINMTREKSKKDYKEALKKLEEENGSEIDDKVKKSLRRNIINRNARKLQVKVMKAAIAVAFTGLVATTGSIYALNESSGRTEGVEQEQNLEEQASKQQAFRDKYQVESLDDMIEAFDMQEEIKREVESLEDKNAVLKYVKAEFVEEYNKINDENITVDSVTLYRTHDNEVYSDTAPNGERIIRVCSKTYAEEHGLKQLFLSTGEVITIRVDNKVVETAVGVYDHFESGYQERQEVDTTKESISEKLGNLLNAGIAYSATLSEENAKPYQSQYRKKLIDEMIKYKELQVQQTTNEQDNNQTKNSGFEVGD